MSGLHGCEGCTNLDRRTFISRTALAAAAVALAACSADGSTAPTELEGTIKVGDHPQLANLNGVALVTVDGSPVAVVRTGTASFVALSRICPHQGNRIDPLSNGFQCTGHGAQFTRTGQWVGGQQTTNMRAYPTRYDAGTDTLTIG